MGSKFHIRVLWPWQIMVHWRFWSMDQYLQHEGKHHIFTIMKTFDTTNCSKQHQIFERLAKITTSLANHTHYKWTIWVAWCCPWWATSTKDDLSVQAPTKWIYLTDGWLCGYHACGKVIKTNAGNRLDCGNQASIGLWVWSKKCGTLCGTCGNTAMAHYTT